VPDCATHVTSLVQQNEQRQGLRPGDLTTRMLGQGVLAELLRKRFEVASRKHGFARSRELQLECGEFVSTQGELF
jgi:hypothetical protein